MDRRHSVSMSECCRWVTECSQQPESIYRRVS